MTDAIRYIRQSLQPFYPEGEIKSLIRLLMERICGIAPHQLLLGKGKELSETERERITEIVNGLKKSVPVQYLLGTADFYGREFKVNPSVLIPRPETEELVDMILKDLRQKPATVPIHILDMGTGSGCIAITLAAELPQAHVTAIDISPEALETACTNAVRLNAQVKFCQADMLSTPTVEKAVPGKFDLIVSNPPYVWVSEKANMKKNVLDYEPPAALFVDDSDPLLFYRAIARFGKKHLREGGTIYFEINALCGKEMKELLQREGYRNICLLQDLSGKDRIIKTSL